MEAGGGSLEAVCITVGMAVGAFAGLWIGAMTMRSTCIQELREQEAIIKELRAQKDVPSYMRDHVPDYIRDQDRPAP